MTTNQHKAAELLLEKDSEESFAVAINHDAFLRASEQRRADAQALADAGLLAPDRVPPSGSEDRSPWWFYLGDQMVGTSGNGDVGIQHTVVTHDEDGSPVHSERWIDLTPDDARHLAAILLTAAAHATQEKK